MVLLFATASGVIIGWIDTRPNWDDTGITTVLILISTIIIGGGSPKWAWLWALIVGGIMVCFNIMMYNNYGSIMALIVAFIGSYIGAIIRKTLFSKK